MNKLYFQNKNLIAIGLLFLSFQLFAQHKAEYAVGHIAEELKEDASVVIRSQTLEFDVKSPETATEKRRTVLTIFNGNTREDQLYVVYDKLQKLTSLKAAVYDSSGRLVKKISKKEISDIAPWQGAYNYDDSRVKWIDFEQSRYPYTIEYEYTLQRNSTMYYPSWDIIGGPRTAVEYSSYIVKVPNTLVIRYKGLNTDIEPQITDGEKGKKIYKWEAKNIKVKQPEPLSNHRDPVVLVSNIEFTLGNYKGKMTDWESYSSFYHQLNSEHNNLSEAMKAEIKKMTANAQTDAQKIEILYTYLQENMRYVSVQLGVGGWKSFDAAYVEKNKFGDCKALTYYMKSMLEEVGISSNPILIQRGRLRYELTEDFIYPAFNHVLLKVPSENCWLECTSKKHPVNYLGGDNSNRKALLIAEEGGRLVDMPNFNAEENAMLNQTAIKLNEKGEAQIKNTSTVKGPQQDLFRYYIADFSPEELKKWFSEITDLPGFKIETMEVEMDDKQPISTFKYSLSVPRFASKAGSRLFIPINILNAFDNVPNEVKNRKQGIMIRESYFDSDEIILTLPNGYEIESLPNEDLELDSEFGTYRLTIEKKEGQLIYKRTLKINSINLPADRYEDLRNFYKEMAKADKMKIVLVKERT